MSTVQKNIGIPVVVAAAMVSGIVTVNTLAPASRPDGSASVTAAEEVLAAAKQRPARRATAVLRTADGTEIGTVDFRRKNGRTVVEATVALPAGLTATEAFHGFHIHANNKPENGDGCLADPAQPSGTWFLSADGHLAEPEQKHSQHTGDLPSLLVNDDGVAMLRFSSTRLQIDDLQDRAVMLHAGPDNFANVPTGSGPDQYSANSSAATDKSAATGNAGDRLACGTVRITR